MTAENIPPDSPTLAPASPGPVVVARTVCDVRAAVAAIRAAGRRVALVPTMGALHEGHLELVRRAAEDGHAVAVSVFVNPTQFGPTEDFSRYPRQLETDTAAAVSAGAELIFAPHVEEIYPDGFATTISLTGPAEGLEAAARPTHFAGVATVVAKLLVATRPDRAVFGQKDGQQVAVVRRMMRDLHLDDIELVVHPTVREADGLAMSSRNAYLSEADRIAARALSRGLRTAVLRAGSGERDGTRLAREAWATMEAEPGCEPEYAALVDPDTFRPIHTMTTPALLCVAALVGPARLIDNAFLPTT
jgi:pantoate--beta-alanine ligase